jgi:hypothetical protein
MTHVKSTRPSAPPGSPWELRSHTIGELPLINRFMDRLGMDDLLARYVPNNDRRLRLSPAKALGLVVRNVLQARAPVYALREWAAAFDPALLGLAADDVAVLNDDRVGRSLDRLFDADRASLLTEVVVRAVREFHVDLEQLHNDSTTVTFSGEYAAATGGAQRGKPTLRITHGHNKDHRPDLEQLLWILTVSADGAVPVHYRACHGNTTDDQTHIATWNTLRALIGRADFLYVGDSKLCTHPALTHIVGQGGRFLTVLPRTRREDKWFRDWIQTHSPDWVEVIRRRHPRRQNGPPDIYWVFEAPLRSAEGFRILWVWSSQKTEHDKQARQDCIEKGILALETLETRLRGPRSRIRDRAALAKAAAHALHLAGAQRWLTLSLHERPHDSFTQEERGRPGSGTRYVRQRRLRFSLQWSPRADTIDYDARTDGMFPLLSNDDILSALDLLEKYKFQPQLEKRHEQLKTVRAVAPVLLKSETRIEALLMVYFLAMLIDALIEREMRRSMTGANIRALPLYPEGRTCKAPTTRRLFEIFAPLQRHELFQRGRLLQCFEPKLSDLQLQILRFLAVPRSAYAIHR